MSEFEEWYESKDFDVASFKYSKKDIARMAWNAAVDAVNENITHRSPQLDQDISQIYSNE